MQALVIDDEPQMRKFVCEVLRNEGWELTEAASAEQAFALIAERQWSAVFCDVILGGADGFSVLKRFKEEQSGAKVVLMTGDGNAAGALDATSFGAYDYLLKPFGPDELQSLSRALREQLQSRPTRRVRTRFGVSGYQVDVGLLGRSVAFIGVM